MPGLYKRKGNYYGVFYAPSRRPRQKWIPLRTKDRRVAATKMRELEMLEAAGEFDPWRDRAHKSATLIEAITAFHRERSREDLSAATLRAERSLLGLIAQELGEDRPVESIEASDLRDFFDACRENGCKPSTLVTYHSRLRHFFGWCTEKAMIRQNPMADIKKPRRARSTVRFLSEPEYEELLRAIQSDRDAVWLEPIVQVAAGTGMRLGELCAMQCDWVRMTPPGVDIRRTKDFRPKGRHERHVPVAGPAETILRRLTEERASGHLFVDDAGERLGSTRVSKAFKRCLRAAGLSEAYSFHVLRHTYASRLVKAGTDLYRVRDLLGHADFATTQRYAHLRPETLRHAVETTFGNESNDRNLTLA